MARGPLAVLLGVTLVAIGIWFARRPRTERDWRPELARLAITRFEGDSLLVHDLRDFRWSEAGLQEARYIDHAFDVDKLESVWFALVPLSKKHRGPAHTFLSFGFKDGPFLSISAEARREKGEKYSAFRGLFRRYELCYVVADERDVLPLRVKAKGAELFLFPIKSTPEARRQLLLEMLKRANRLAEKPEFYNTLTNNCATNILKHVNTVLKKPIPWGPAILLPGYSDRLARRFDLVDARDAPRERFRVTARAARLPDGKDYSRRLRENL